MKIWIRCNDILMRVSSWCDSMELPRANLFHAATQDTPNILSYKWHIMYGTILKIRVMYCKWYTTYGVVSKVRQHFLTNSAQPTQPNVQIQHNMLQR